jgi:ankyrin repeat protein
MSPGYNPIQCASAHGHLQTVKLLVCLGANFLVTDHLGRIPMQIALENKRKDVVHFLSKIAQQYVFLLNFFNLFIYLFIFFIILFVIID